MHFYIKDHLGQQLRLVHNVEDRHYLNEWRISILDLNYIRDVVFVTLSLPPGMRELIIWPSTSRMVQT